MRTYIISPVKNIPEEQSVFLYRYVQQFEWNRGHVVHFPLRNTKQDDPAGGINICRTDFWAMFRAGEIHVFYDPTSEEFTFDLGMVFALVELTKKYRILRWIIGRKNIILINPKAVDEQIRKESNEGIRIKRSFARVLSRLDIDSFS